MTNEILQRIAKKHKINLDHHDEVFGFINEKYTFVHIVFASRENINGTAYHLNQVALKLSVAAIMKRCEDETEYCTNGWNWIYEIKSR